MRVLHIHERDLEPVAPGRVRPRTSAGADRVGGLGAYICALLDALTDEHIEISTLAVGPATGVADDALRYDEAPSFRFRFDRAKHDAIVRAVQRAAPDLVHLHAAYFTLHPRTIAALRDRFPVLATLHDVTTLCFRGDKCIRGTRPCDKPVGIACVARGCYRPAQRMPLAPDLARIATAGRIRAAYAALSHIFAPSSFIRAVLTTNGCAPGRVEVVPLFSRFESFAHAHTPPSIDPMILFVGRLDAGKGADLFIQALNHLPADNWTAQIVGDGPLRDAVHHAARSVGARLLMRGSLDHQQLADAYRSARVIVFPSTIQESFGLIGVEAMSFSRPVVAFPSGGVTEWLDDRRTGILVPYAAPPDTRALAHAIAALIDDPARAAEMGEAGRRAVLTRFNRAAHVQSITRAYERVLTTARRRGAAR